MKLLLTGFAPFGGETTNPSWEAVRRLPDTLTVNGKTVQLCKRELPVAYDRVGALLAEAIAETAPDAVLCVGQAAGRSGITPERVAINWKGAAAPDNDGVQYDGETILPDGPDGLFATIPVDAMAAACRAAGVPAQVSLSAGSYVCNCLMYQLLACHDVRVFSSGLAPRSLSISARSGLSRSL